MFTAFPYFSFMNFKTLLYGIILSTALSACFSVNRPEEKLDTLPLDQIKLPDGFEISIFAEGVVNARSMVRSEQGTLYVGSRDAGKVYAIKDTDGDFKADELIVLAEGLNTPNGVAYKDGNLYVAEIDKIWRFDDIENNLSAPKKTLLDDQFPDDKWHGWKYIAFGPDDKLYVPVGAPCNVCENEDERYASIMRMNADGSEKEVYAQGVRNSVGFDWHPEKAELWFTNNGRDMLGDDIPHDELNHAPRKGMHFGFPYCHEGTLPDPRFGKKRDCNEFTAPAQRLLPHTAALGMKFYTGTQFPESFKHDILIAEHGSWNRTQPQGYRISRVKLEGDRAVSYEAFAEGWLGESKAWGRPVDILQLPDGSLLVSDDFADVIYRISYRAA